MHYWQICGLDLLVGILSMAGQLGQICGQRQRTPLFIKKKKKKRQSRQKWDTKNLACKQRSDWKDKNFTTQGIWDLMCR